MQVCQGKKSAVHLSDRGKGIWHKITFEIAGKDTVHVESVFIVFCFIQMIGTFGIRVHLLEEIYVSRIVRQDFFNPL